jgi:uncharacterized membrane protein (UPF0136 family)
MATAEGTLRERLRGSRLTPARAATLARRVPIVLAALLVLGIALRIAVSVAYDPAVLGWADSTVYLLMATDGLFIDAVRPAGYSMFLRGVHGVWADVDLLIVVQHLLGLATGLILYAAVRRLGGPVWAGAAGAAAVLLSLDQIVLEHALMTETLFTVMFAVVLYAAVRAFDDSRPLVWRLTTRHAWLATAGVLLGLATWVRAVGVGLIPLLALWVALALPGRLWERVGRAALAGGTAVAILFVYFALNNSASGHFGLTHASGWALYSRTAPFADCDRFDPPAGSEALCETTDPDSRNGPDFYSWEQGSPAVRMFGGPPLGDATLADFARETVVHQPADYARAVARDTIRYFVPTLAVNPFNGFGYDSLDIERRSPVIEQDVSSRIDEYYADESVAIEGGVSALGAVQDWLRVQPALMGIALIAGVIGMVLGNRRQRWGLVLLLGASLALLVLPSATTSYNARYAIPIGGPLIAAGALGAWLLIRRLAQFDADHG